MPKGKSFALVVVLASAVIVLMPFLRALVLGDNEAVVATAYTLGAPPAAPQPGLAGSQPANVLPMLLAGAGLLCLGGVLRRAA